MKRLIPVLCAIILWTGCAAPATIVTPQGQAAYTADQIVTRINELQNVAIAAEQAKSVPTDTVRVIVSFCVGADKTLAAVPSGWQATVYQAWQASKNQIPPAQLANPAIVAAVSAVDVALAAIGGK